MAISERCLLRVDLDAVSFAYNNALSGWQAIYL